jgi:hypothetical protein
MQTHCLNRVEYKELIDKLINNKNVSECIEGIIYRSQIYWDLNIIASNYPLSILCEQNQKKEIPSNDLINSIYSLQNLMFLSIDELDFDCIDELFTNHLPENRNNYLDQLDEAKKSNDSNRIEYLNQQLNDSFEEDLYSILQNYYEKKHLHR